MVNTKGQGVKVKICGITSLEDALAAVQAGCDALGFNFFKKSPRYITPDEAAGIIRRLPKTVVKIGIFVNAREKTIRKTAGLCRLNMLQFHGGESPEFCARFKGQKVIKTFRVDQCFDPERVNNYKKVFAVLFDSFDYGKYGGTGKKFNWKLLPHLSRIKQPVFLSGGLNHINVRRAICLAHPQWVDACSSLEVSPGKKDHAKIRKFIKAAKGQH